MPKRRVTVLVVCLLACLAPAQAQAAAQTETATSGQVTAAFSYVQRHDEFSDLRLVIQRGGVVALDQRVASPGCEFACWPGGVVQRKSVRLRDLDGDGEPEVLLDLFTGGAHCCLVLQVFSLNQPVGDVPSYSRSEHNFLDLGYELVDMDHEGTPELRSADGRFAYALSSFAGSAFPIQVWRFRAGALVDVTREFPDLVLADSKHHWRRYRKEIRHRAPYNDAGLGALAAWAGDEYLLGHGDRVQRELRSALRRGWLNGTFTHGRGTVRELNKLLSAAGYR
jgi:hypothetical protein